MGEDLSEAEYVRGIEGLALLRARAGRDLPTSDPVTGYAVWAATYDDPGNDTMAIEEPVVLELLAGLPAGPVLDAACGTGRYMEHLLAAGRDVVGMDASPEMLAAACAKLPGADLREGTLIPEYPHLASDYVEAFGAAGLTVSRCLEPRLDAAQARAHAKGGRADAFAQALTGLPAVIVWEVEA